MMKRFFINKTLKAFALAFALVAVLSCKNGVEPEQNVKDDNKATISLKIHNLDEYKLEKAKTERTVNPVIELNELTDFVLSGAKTGATQTQLASFDTLADLPESIDVPFEATTEEWTFTLTAKKGYSVISGSTAKTLQTGNNELEIAVSLEDFAEGTGNFAITVDFSSAVNCDTITSATAYIVEKNNSSSLPMNEMTFSSTDFQYDYKFTYIGEGYYDGTYRAVIKLYKGEYVLGYWQDLINISDSLTSSATATIDKLNKAYSVDYFIWRADEPGDNTLDFEPQYVIPETQKTLPVPSRDDYAFMGWYTDYDLTTPVVLPLTQDTNLYAYWESLIPPADGSYYPAKAETVYDVISSVTEGSVSSPAVIKVFGKITSSTLSTICNAISSNYYDSNSNLINYKIDLSHTYGLSVIPAYAFSNCSNLAEFVIPEGVTEIGYEAFSECDNLVGVVIPEGVTEIGESAFFSCNHLGEIEIPDSIALIGEEAFFDCKSLKKIEVSGNNQNYKSVDGVLYSKDGTVLIKYPAGKNTEEFEVPYGVETIEGNAFYDARNLDEITISDSVTDISEAFVFCYNLETVNIGAGVTSVTGKDFSECSNITTITVSNQNEYYTVGNDGVLYTKDGKTIALYPNGDTRTTYTVPSSVEYIENIALCDADNLSQVVFPDDGAAWYYGNIYSFENPIDIIWHGTKLNVSYYSGNCYYLKNYSCCKKINDFQSVWEELVDSVPVAAVYNSENTDVSNTTEPFEFVVTTDSDFKFYKIETKVGSNYNINFVDSNNYYNYTLPEDWIPEDCVIAVFGADGSNVVDKRDSASGTSSISFIARTSETYIGLQDFAENGSINCAFRVWSQLVKTGVSVTMAPDVPVAYEADDSDNYHFFVEDNIYDSYTWYVNGVDNYNNNHEDSFDFDTSEYSNGVYLITLEVEKDGLSYSYSFQLSVQKSDENTQC